jgi:predicted HicB family RNase H-like nuclease
VTGQTTALLDLDMQAKRDKMAKKKKKLPPITPIRINERVKLELQIHCLKEKISMNKFIEQLIIKQLIKIVETNILNGKL